MLKTQIPNPKSQTNFPAKTGSRKMRNNTQYPITKPLVIGNWLLAIIWLLVFGAYNFSVFAQEVDLEFKLDINSSTVPLPTIFRPNIDLSGRGFQQDNSWPKELAAAEVLDTWQKDIGFSNIYRLQYSLWEINQLAKDRDLQSKLLGNYENIMERITAAGGVVILDIFSTPAGLGKVLDKKSPLWDLKAFKALIKNYIRELSCNKRYNVWYEVWSAPDLNSFFLGRKQDYLSLYRAVAEAAKELEAETKIYIPVGGPSASWWFQNLSGNTIVTAERSLIYELIKFCASYRLPLDFITWHAYSIDPQVEKENTRYKKNNVALIRDWLSYFNFDKNTPLIIDEWNYDRQENVLAERDKDSFVCASYIPVRLQNMYEAGLNCQFYFSLEDFQSNKEGVNRNVGIFWFDRDAPAYKGGPKLIYNVFRMLAKLGDNFFVAPNLKDEFVGVIATKRQDYFALIISNYIDPEISENYLSRNLATLNNSERKIILDMIKSGRLTKILLRELDISALRVTKRLKAMLKKAQELYEQALQFKISARNIKIEIKNINGDYLYQRYTIDSSSTASSEFFPVEEKKIGASGLYQETLSLSPYSVNMLVLKKKPLELESLPSAPEKKTKEDIPTKSE